MVAVSLLSQSCTKEYFRIEGIGQVRTETLDIDAFTAIRLEGADDVEMKYGPVQKVEVTGHSTLFPASRLRSVTVNGSWAWKTGTTVTIN